MDISYWIFILIVYLISQWIQSRTKNISDQDDKPKNDGFSIDKQDPSFGNKNLPQWITNLDPQGNSFKDLNFNQTDDFNIQSITQPEESVDEIEQNIQDDESFEDIKEDVEEKFLDGIEEINKEETQSFNQPIIEDLNQKQINFKRHKSFNIFDILDNKSDIKKAILLREILSPPRALNKYSIKK